MSHRRGSGADRLLTRGGARFALPAAVCLLLSAAACSAPQPRPPPSASTTAERSTPARTASPGGCTSEAPSPGSASGASVGRQTCSGPAPAWIHQFGTGGADAAAGVAQDRDGNIYVVGETTGDLEGK